MFLRYILLFSGIEEFFCKSVENERGVSESLVHQTLYSRLASQA